MNYLGLSTPGIRNSFWVCSKMNFQGNLEEHHVELTYTVDKTPNKRVKKTSLFILRKGYTTNFSVKQSLINKNHMASKSAYTQSIMDSFDNQHKKS